MVKKLLFWFRERFSSPKREIETPFFDFSQHGDPLALASVISRERPQTIALILSYMDKNQASVILKHLYHELQSDVVRRIVRMGRVKPETLRLIKRILEEELPPLEKDDVAPRGGIEDAVGILQRADKIVESYIMRMLEEEDPELAEEVKEMQPKARSKKIGG